MTTNQKLEHRDDDVEAFTFLNKAIDTLPDRTPTLKPKGNKSCYINVAKMLNNKLDLYGKGYNGTDANTLIQAKKEQYENNLVFAIRIGLITSYTELKSAIEKL